MEMNEFERKWMEVRLDSFVCEFCGLDIYQFGDEVIFLQTFIIP